VLSTTVTTTMGRDLKVHFFKDREAYNNGDYDYYEHKDDFSLNMKRNTDMPWSWSGSPKDIVDIITKKATKLQNLITFDDEGNEHTPEEQMQVFDNENMTFESKAKVISIYALILAECPTDCSFITIEND
jgi:hypothetical protein